MVHTGTVSDGEVQVRAHTHSATVHTETRNNTKECRTYVCVGEAAGIHGVHSILILQLQLHVALLGRVAPVRALAQGYIVLAVVLRDGTVVDVQGAACGQVMVPCRRARAHSHGQTTKGPQSGTTRQKTKKSASKQARTGWVLHRQLAHAQAMRFKVAQQLVNVLVAQPVGARSRQDAAGRRMWQGRRGCIGRRRRRRRQQHILLGGAGAGRRGRAVGVGVGVTRGRATATRASPRATRFSSGGSGDCGRRSSSSCHGQSPSCGRGRSGGDFSLTGVRAVAVSVVVDSSHDVGVAVAGWGRGVNGATGRRACSDGGVDGQRGCGLVRGSADGGGGGQLRGTVGLGRQRWRRKTVQG